MWLSTILFPSGWASIMHSKVALDLDFASAVVVLLSDFFLFLLLFRAGLLLIQLNH